MNKKRNHLRQSAAQIEKLTHTTSFVAIGAASAFIAGLILARKKNIPELIQYGRTVTALSRKLKKGAKLLSLLFF